MLHHFLIKSLSVFARTRTHTVNLRRWPVSTGMGDRVRVRFPVRDIYFDM